MPVWIPVFTGNLSLLLRLISHSLICTDTRRQVPFFYEKLSLLFCTETFFNLFFAHSLFCTAAKCPAFNICLTPNKQEDNARRSLKRSLLHSLVVCDPQLGIAHVSHDCFKARSQPLSSFLSSSSPFSEYPPKTHHSSPTSVYRRRLQQVYFSASKDAFSTTSSVVLSCLSIASQKDLLQHHQHPKNEAIFLRGNRQNQQHYFQQPQRDKPPKYLVYLLSCKRDARLEI